MNQAAICSAQNAFGITHPVMLRLMINMGHTLYSADRSAEAEKLHRHVLAVRERTCGVEHEDTLKSVYALGNALCSQDKLVGAEEMLRRALEGRVKMFGATHRDTRFVGIKPMGVLRKMGREDESDEVLVRYFPGKEDDDVLI